MAVRAPALDRDQTALLTKLFNELDRNGDGKLDIDEFKLFGKAISGKEVTDTQARMQITRADRNKDESIDLDEFLAFSAMLGKLPPDSFRATIELYTRKVREEMARVARAKSAGTAAGSSKAEDESKA